jgi:hypothetical protein
MTLLEQWYCFVEIQIFCHAFVTYALTYARAKRTTPGMFFWVIESERWTPTEVFLLSANFWFCLCAAAYKMIQESSNLI